MTQALHRTICLLLALTWAVSAAQAEPHVPDVPHAPQTNAHPAQADGAEENLAAQPPVQAYYHRAFFGEPWRTPRESITRLAQHGVGAATGAAALSLVLWWRRRKWLRGGRQG